MDIDARNQRRIDLILSGQEALIGAVTPNLRVVEATWNDRHITLHFIYDGPFTKEDEEESQRVAAKIKQDFPESVVHALVSRNDYPNRFREHNEDNCTWLYARKEKAKNHLSDDV